jgi:photosystem II stability/assembly factor-like uncharacterized protein
MTLLFQIIQQVTALQNVRYYIFIALFLTPLLSYGQWVNVAPNLLGNQSFQMSCITHQSGIVWAGTKEVFMSSDFGNTWTKRSPTIRANDVVRYINFFDANIGVVGTDDGEVFMTRDQGVTWSLIKKVSSVGAIAFLGSPDNIIISTHAANGEMVSTRDGGATWLTQSLGSYTPDVKALLGSSAIALVGYTPTGGMSELHLTKTTDYGQTWTELPGKMDFDTYSFDVDPCDPQFVYVINEDGSVTRDFMAQIYRSTDGGNSWLISDQQPIPGSTEYYSGSIWLTGNAIFVQTVANGIMRSTDKGVSWTNIGGPSAIFDTRLVCAMNANLVFAADNNGSIWRTQNSGGDSLAIGSPYQALNTIPTRLFTLDSLINCDSPVVSMVRLRGGLCKFPKVIGEKITGRDSLDYKIVQSVGDSLRGNDSAYISFQPRGSGDRRGYYIILLEDGSEIAVPLEGFGKYIKYIEPFTINAKTDTIGGWVAVPFAIMGLDRPQDVELSVIFDTDLIYLGSFDNNGSIVDIAGSSSTGRSRIRVPKEVIRLDSASGFAYFIVYPREGPCPKVYFDSMSITSPTAPCEYTLGTGVVAEVCPPEGCGIMILTNFILKGEMPDLRAFPNPSNGVLYISSDKPAGDVVIRISDEQGREHFRKSAIISSDTKLELDLHHLPAGHYYLEAVSGSGRRTLSFVMLR